MPIGKIIFLKLVSVHCSLDKWADTELIYLKIKLVTS